MSDGQNTLQALGGNYMANLDRRAKQEQSDLEARREAALTSLLSQKDALLSGQSGLGQDSVNQRVAKIDKQIADISGAQGKTYSQVDPSLFGKSGRLVGSVLEQTLGGQAIADFMTPTDAPEEAYRRNQALASVIPAVATLKAPIGKVPGAIAKAGRGVAQAGRAATKATLGATPSEIAVMMSGKSPGALAAEEAFASKQAAQAAALRNAPKPSGLVSKLPKSERIAGTAQAAQARAGATASADELRRAAESISAMGGDFERGLQATKLPKASSPIKAPSSGPLPSPQPAGGGPNLGLNPGSVGPSSAPPSGPASAPAPATSPVATSSLSSLLKKLSLPLTAGTAGWLGSNYVNNAVDEVRAEDAMPTEFTMPELQTKETMQPQLASAEAASAAQVTPQADPQMDFIRQLLGAGQGQVAPQSNALLSDGDIGQIQKLVQSIVPQQQAAAPTQVEKPSMTSQIIDGLGRALIAGGTGDMRAAYADKDEARNQRLADEQIRRSQQQQSPEQAFAQQLLGNILSQRIGQVGQSRSMQQQAGYNQQQQANQIAAQMLSLDREQQNALARGDQQAAVQFELQKREAAARLEQIRAQQTGMLEMFNNPMVKSLMSQGGQQVNQ